MKTQSVSITFIALVMTVSLLSGSCQGPGEQEEKNLKVEYINDSIDPGDNFYQFANDGWMEAHPLPEDESRFGSFDLLRKNTKQKVKNILEQCAEGEYESGSIEQKIGDLYGLGMDTAKIKRQGLQPVEDELKSIEAIQTKKELINRLTYFHKYAIGSLFRFSSGADAKNSKMNIAQLSQGGLGMSDRDYYLKDDERTKEIRKAYRNFIPKIFKLAGLSGEEVGAKTETVMEMETQLARASMTRLERRDPNKTYNKMKLEELKQLCPNFNWENYFKGLEIAVPDSMNVHQPDFFKKVNDMLGNVSLDDWKTYLRWNLLNSMAAYLTPEFVKANFEFYGKTMQGQQEMKPRWRRVLDVTNRSLGQPIGKKFVEEHFPPEAKDRMITLVNNLQDAFAQRIKRLEWMSEETKSKALDKLSVMNVKIGYPDEWRDFSDLTIDTSSYVSNVLATRKFNKKYQLDKIGEPVDEDEWFMPPQTVNAYYSPSMNEICFPAGILQPPFFYLEGDAAVNYGGIGGVIGHEMTHGFDDQGKKYDKEGNLNNWWTDKDEERFEERSDILVKQYNQKTVLDTVHANGELTLGENIADLGGVSISYTAFKNATRDKNLPEKIDGYTPNQRFFLAWARVWAQNIRDEEIRRRTQEDVHSLGIHRVNGPLPNVDAFYKAFNITKEDKLYLPEEKRAKIW
ncbi:MAG: M13 family metallopeptidase [Bacteroidales bacterium]|nr:M13 family metallopeptidase [Bacteroidales bacterium]